MNGKLIIRIYADTIAQPVENAEIQIVGNGIYTSLTTDSNGQTEPIELWTPPLELSLTPSQKKAYADYNITVTRFGLKPKTVYGVEVYSGITSFQDIILNSVDESTSNSSTIVIPDFFVGSYPPKIPQKPLQPEFSPRVLPYVFIPEYIVVHDGVPTSTNVPNYNVLFKDYIKNVACSEIYSTWPVETIKANVLAIISLTLNRVFTEWYRSKGYDFTITSSTQFDQKFIYGRTIFDSISNVVDDIFQNYIVLGNSNFPFFSQYCDGVIVNRPNWLSQWGSKNLGDKGYSALQILKHYYTDAAHLDYAEELEGFPTSFPGFNLKIDSCGLDVQTIQNQLNVIRGSYPAIPLITPANGKFGPKTAEAVKVFQGVFGLPKTGIVDYNTWYKISAIYIAIAKLMEGLY